MNKEEFLNKLRKKLDILEDKEIEDIISEYEGYIEEKVSRGLSEEEAVKELGDINEIVSDLLAAYKVKQKDNNYFKKFINKISLGFDYILNELNNKSGKDILKFIIEICLIILLVFIFKIPFLLIKDLGWHIFSNFASPISDIFYGIWSFIIELSYFILAVVLFIKIIEKRYFKGFSEKIVTEIEEEKEHKENRKQKEEKKKEEKEVKTESEKTGIIDLITNICILFLKFIAIFCLIGVIFYLVGMVFAIGIGIYLFMKGVTYFGIFILLIALFQIGILLLELGVYFIFNKKIKAGHILGEVITIIVLSGLGLALSAVEVANTEIIYDSMIKETKTVSEELDVRDDLVLYGQYNIVIDNTLIDKIKIEYVYPDIEDIKVNIDLERYNNGYYLDYTISNITWNKKLLNEIIENLKDKKIYVDNFEIEKNVYMSEETRDLLFQNKDTNSDVIYEFTRTYNIRNIEESNDEAYLYITLRQFQFEEVATVKVLKSMANSIEEGNNYEFTFRYNYPSTELLDDTIEEIFEKCHLVSINYTDKVGLEQTQEPEIPQN